MAQNKKGATETSCYRMWDSFIQAWLIQLPNKSDVINIKTTLFTLNVQIEC